MGAVTVATFPNEGEAAILNQMFKTPSASPTYYLCLYSSVIGGAIPAASDPDTAVFTDFTWLPSAGNAGYNPTQLTTTTWNIDATVAKAVATAGGVASVPFQWTATTTWVNNPVGFAIVKTTGALSGGVPASGTIIMYQNEALMNMTANSVYQVSISITLS